MVIRLSRLCDMRFVFFNFACLMYFTKTIKGLSCIVVQIKTIYRGAGGATIEGSGLEEKFVSM